MGLLTLKFATDVRDNDYEVVEFHGELDQSTVGNAEKRLIEFLADYKRKFLIFDFADLKFTNSEGIGFVVEIHAKLTNKKQSLILCSLKPNVAEVLDAMGLPKLFHVFLNLSEAINFTKRPSLSEVMPRLSAVPKQGRPKPLMPPQTGATL